MIPKSRPNLDRETVRRYLAFAAQSFSIVLPEGVLVLAIRGYYLDSQGKAGANDRGIYDDAIVVVSPAHCAAYNANTDPSRQRHGMAVLKPGTWSYKPGIHGLSKPVTQRYPAFVQDMPVTVVRDNLAEDTGWFGINIHTGGDTTTSSLGCQTIPPGQWENFRSLLNSELRARKQKAFWYLLVEETAFREWVKTKEVGHNTPSNFDSENDGRFRPATKGGS